MVSKEIIKEIKEILNVYKDTMTKDVEQSLKNLIDYIKEEKKPKDITQKEWVKGYNKWKEEHEQTKWTTTSIRLVVYYS